MTIDDIDFTVDEHSIDSRRIRGGKNLKWENGE